MVDLARFDQEQCNIIHLSSNILNIYKFRNFDTNISVTFLSSELTPEIVEVSSFGKQHARVPVSSAASVAGRHATQTLQLCPRVFTNICISVFTLSSERPEKRLMSR